MSAIVTTLGLAAVGCTAPNPTTWSLDADGTRMGNGAADLSSALEYALAGASLITETNLAGPEGVDGARASLGWLMGSCAEALAMPSGVRGIDVHFAAPCSVPTTSLAFTGAVSGTLSDDTSGTITIRFTQLGVSNLTFDGAMTLTPTAARTFTFDTRGLHVVDVGGKTAPRTLDASGVAALSTDHALFHGAGTIVEEKQHFYLFDAEDVSRSFADGCYPNRGRILLTDASTTSSTPLTASLEFENDPRGLSTDVSGDARLIWDDHTTSISMPPRDCPGM